MGRACLVAGENIVCTILLVRRDEIRVIDAGQGLHESHLLVDHGLQGRLENLRPVHGRRDVHAADVPATDDKVIWVDHGQHVVEGDVDLDAGSNLRPQFDGGTHDDRAVVVGSTRTFTSIPNKTTTVGNDTGRDGGPIVTAPTNQHHANLGNLAVDLEVVGGLLRRSRVFAIRRLGDGGGAIHVLALDVVVSVRDIGRVDGEKILGGLSRVEGLGNAVPVRGADASFRVRCHFDLLNIGRRSLIRFGARSGFNRWRGLVGFGRIRCSSRRRRASATVERVVRPERHDVSEDIVENGREDQRENQEPEFATGPAISNNEATARTGENDNQRGMDSRMGARA